MRHIYLAYLIMVSGIGFAQSPTFEIIFLDTIGQAVNMGDGVFDAEGNYYTFQERVDNTSQPLIKVFPDGNYILIDSIHSPEKGNLTSHDAFNYENELYFIFENANSETCLNSTGNEFCISIYMFDTQTNVIRHILDFSDSIYFSPLVFPVYNKFKKSKHIIAYYGYTIYDTVSSFEQKLYASYAELSPDFKIQQNKLITDTVEPNGYIGKFFVQLKNSNLVNALYTKANNNTERAEAYIQLRDSIGNFLKQNIIRYSDEDATIEPILIDYPNGKVGVLYNSMYDINSNPPRVDRKLHYNYDLDTATMEFKHKYVVRGVNKPSVRQSFLQPHIREVRNSNLYFVDISSDTVRLYNMDTTGFIRFERKFFGDGGNIFDLDIAPDGSIMCSGTYLLDAVTNDRRPYILKLDSLGCLDEWEQCPVFSPSDTVNTSNKPPLGLDEIRTYPNPTASQLFVEIPESYLNTSFLKLYDMTGNLVSNQQVSQTREIIEMGTLPSGPYVLTLEYPRGRISKQVLKR